MKSLIASLVLLTACTAPPAAEPDPTDAGTSVSDAGEPLPDAGEPLPDAGGPLPDAGEPAPDAGVDRVTLAATDGTLGVPFRMQVSGRGTSRVGAVAMNSNTGTVVVDGETLPAVSYSRTEFPGYVLYQTLAVEQDRWVVLWLYCSGTRLSDVYLHSTDGVATEHEPGFGTCTDEATMAHDVTVTFPAVDMRVSPLRGEYHVEGADLLIDGPQPGFVRFGAREMTVLPYNLVDCGTGCGMPGWQEIHAILHDGTNGVGCFAIFYLIDGADDVTIAYSLSLPDLSEPAAVTRLPASWWRLGG